MKEIIIPYITPSDVVPNSLNASRSETIFFFGKKFCVANWDTNEVRMLPEKFMRPHYGFTFCGKVFVADEYTQILYTETDVDWHAVEGLLVPASSCLSFDGMNLWIANQTELTRYNLMLGKVTKRIALRKPRLFGMMYLYKDILHIADNLYKGYKELDIEALDIRDCKFVKPLVFEDSYKIDSVISAGYQLIFRGASNYTYVNCHGMRHVYDGKLYSYRPEDTRLVVTRNNDQELEYLF